jgi:hypothetical protein
MSFVFQIANLFNWFSVFRSSNWIAMIFRGSFHPETRTECSPFTLTRSVLGGFNPNVFDALPTVFILLPTKGESTLENRT